MSSDLEHSTLTAPARPATDASSSNFEFMSDVAAEPQANDGQSSLRRAVIDIGSNSVRMVVYDGPLRAPFAICNEKSLCGLGRNMGPDGSLNPDAVAFALATLKRFRGLLNDYGAPVVYAVATAAVRSASDGEEFVRRANAIGFDIDVIDGAREAALAALGVLSYEPDAEGLVGDMGGGSLELIEVSGGALGSAISLPVGPLALMQQTDGDLKKAKTLIEDALDGCGWLAGKGERALYTVGGAWRAIARIHMQLRNHPLSILHHYEVSAREAADVCRFIASQSRASLQEIPGIPRRRIETLPYAALVLSAVLMRAGVSKLLVSAGGLREGVIYDHLTTEERKADPLLSGAAFLAGRLSPTPSYGAAVARALAPLFQSADETDRRLVTAASTLIDAGAFFHPDLRGEHLYDTALRTPFYSIAHADRVALALALYTRHEGKDVYSLERPEFTLIPLARREWAIRLGLALRLLASFAPKSPAPLDGVTVSMRGETLVFSTPARRADLVQDLIIRRLDALATAFGVKGRVEFT
ncbi:MAG: Ppx/GppA family phosphatase [Pseudomonadota bacterium]